MRHVLSAVSLVAIALVDRASFAQVTFTPAAEMDRAASRPPALRGVTFTPGPRRSGVARTDEPAAPSRAPESNARSAEPSPRPCDERPRASAAPERETPVAQTSEPAERAARVTLPEPRVVVRAEPVTTPAVIAAPEPRAEPTASGVTECALVNGVEEVSIEDATSSREGAFRAQEIALSSYGRDAVALITMARVGHGREGLVFSQSRVVSIAPDRPVSVARAPGFEPGAVVALGPDHAVYVLSSARLDTRNQRAGHAARDLELTVLDARGSVRVATRAIEGTRGYTLDSAPVAWRGGVSVVLGEPTILGEERAFGPVRERVYSFDHEGALRGAPWVLTEAQSPDAVGRFRVGLGRISGGDALAAVFSDGRALSVRRFVGSAPAEAAQRVYEGRAWAPEVSHDGASLIFREGGTDGRPVRLRVARWDGANPLDVGQGWEPLASVHRGRVLVAGALVGLDDGRRTTALFTEGTGRDRPRVLASPSGSHQRLDDAIDVAMSPTDDGALLAWIESVDRASPDGPRRLAVARVRCR